MQLKIYYMYAATLLVALKQKILLLNGSVIDTG
jgi:hypothetical protein